ncbi:MAG TPA: hypothetical protein VMB18_14100 [Terriglobales bacterium]|nr:hypothetical protein [Terriglobales bacterium]
MKSVLRWWVILALIGTSLAQTATTETKKKPARATTMAAKDVQELKDALAAQQQQIQQLRDEMRQRDAALQQAQQQVQQAQQAAQAAEAKAEQAAQEASQQSQAVSNLKTDVSDMKQNETNAALSLQETQKNIKSALENPVAIHYKGIDITPGGFLAAETVWRQHALGSDINTPFNSIPFDGSTAAHMSEFFGSGRQSRISMLAEGKLDNMKLSGYVEADFLSAGTTSNNNESNSYSLRQRQAWGQAALNDGWTFTGGQMWSLVTETKKGVDNRTEALPMTIDPQYNVGFSWARQYGFRVSKNLNNKAWLAFSVENAQTTLGGHGATNNFIIGSQGAGGGLYNGTANYSFNATPDFVGKIVFEPGFGHYEVFGVVRDFRDRVFPCGGNLSASGGLLPATTTCNGSKFPNALGANNVSAWGGGGGANVRFTMAHHVDLGFHFLGGEGIGRYGSAGLPDVIAAPAGYLVPLTEYQALATLEYHSKRWDIYSNAGAEYAGRQAYGTSNIGYGSPNASNSGCYTELPPSSTIINVLVPGSSTLPVTPTSGTVSPVGSLGTPLTGGFNPANASCNGDTRVIFEGTLGFWYRVYSGPKGRLQFGPQYSYIDRNQWAAIKGGGPNATENMFLTSFRYYLP